MTKTELNTFLANFKLTSTDNITDVGKNDIKRKMLAIYIKKASDENSQYELLGYRQESMSIASNNDTADSTDVNGFHYTDFNGKNEKIEMSEYRTNPKKTKFLETAIKLKISDQEEDMKDYMVLIVRGYLRNEDNHCLAIEESDCTVFLDNEGNQSFLTHDVSIGLSGNKKFGTVPEIIATPTFTEYTVPAKAE